MYDRVKSLKRSLRNLNRQVRLLRREDAIDDEERIIVDLYITRLLSKIENLYDAYREYDDMKRTQELFPPNNTRPTDNPFNPTVDPNPVNPNPNPVNPNPVDPNNNDNPFNPDTQPDTLPQFYQLSLMMDTFNVLNIKLQYNEFMNQELFSLIYPKDNVPDQPFEAFLTSNQLRLFVSSQHLPEFMSYYQSIKQPNNKLNLNTFLSSYRSYINQHIIPVINSRITTIETTPKYKKYIYETAVPEANAFREYIDRLIFNNTKVCVQTSLYTDTSNNGGGTTDNPTDGGGTTNPDTGSETT